MVVFEDKDEKDQLWSKLSMKIVDDIVKRRGSIAITNVSFLSVCRDIKLLNEIVKLKCNISGFKQQKEIHHRGELSQISWRRNGNKKDSGRKANDNKQSENCKKGSETGKRSSRQPYEELQ